MQGDLVCKLLCISAKDPWKGIKGGALSPKIPFFQGSNYHKLHRLTYHSLSAPVLSYITLHLISLSLPDPAKLHFVTVNQFT